MRTRPPWPTAPFPASREEPYTGPATGDQIDSLAVLGGIARKQAAARAATLSFPVYTGPHTGDTLTRLAMIAEVQARAALAVELEGLPRALPEPAHRPRPVGSAGGHLGHRPAAVLEAAERAVRPVALTAALVPWRRAAVLTVLTAGCAAWGARHALALRDGGGTPLGALSLVAFTALAWQVILYHRGSRPVRSGRDASRLRVTVAVPCYNEDPAILRASLESMLAQTRLPGHVYVVDDGSAAADYEAVRLEMAGRFAAAGVRLSWERTPNRGKRHAQSVAVLATPDTDVYVTVDSDATLAPDAIAEILVPFADRRVQSVAGVVLSSNNRATLLARLLDLLYTSMQLLGRGGLSAMGAVLVNSGGLAAYRAGVLRDAMPAYLGETFFGRRVEFSDDSFLTLLARARGRTVQQPSAIVFCAMPERWSHHRRQYLRWMRGSFIRSWGRFRYLPLRSYAYWWHLAAWALVAMTAWGAGDAVLVAARGGGSLAWLVMPAAVSYGVTLPYLTIRRSDEPWRSRVGTWLLAPLAVLWALTVLRAFRWWGMATCLKTGWGTRQEVELTL